MYIRSLANSLDQAFKQRSTFYVRLSISQVSLLNSFYYNLIWRSWKLILNVFVVSIPPLSGLGLVKMLAWSFGQELISQKTQWSKCRCNDNNFYKLILMRLIGLICIWKVLLSTDRITKHILACTLTKFLLHKSFASIYSKYRLERFLNILKYFNCRHLHLK
jgi:hypothetical protein